MNRRSQNDALSMFLRAGLLCYLTGYNGFLKINPWLLNQDGFDLVASQTQLRSEISLQHLHFGPC
jgi:hypothetical protein